MVRRYGYWWSWPTGSYPASGRHLPVRGNRASFAAEGVHNGGNQRFNLEPGLDSHRLHAGRQLELVKDRMSAILRNYNMVMLALMAIAAAVFYILRFRRKTVGTGLRPDGPTCTWAPCTSTCRAPRLYLGRYGSPLEAELAREEHLVHFLTLFAPSPEANA